VFPIIVSAIVLLAMSVLFHVIPGLTRPGVFFGVTVPPEFRQTMDARVILHRYRTILWSFTTVALALAVALGMEAATLLCQAAGFLAAFAIARRETQAHAAPADAIREVDLSLPPETLPGGPVVLLPPILSLYALALWAATHWDALPPRFPVHWGIHGADRWVDRTPAAIYGFLAVHASLCLLLAALAWGLPHWSRRIATAGAGAAAERRFRRQTTRLLIVTEYFLACPAWIALLQPGPAAIAIWGIALAVTIAGFTISLLRSGQGGSRRVFTQDAGDHTPDACWKWGLVYVNPADPAILIEKRFGIGYTLNLGNRWSWVVIGLTLAPAALALLFLR
jgi:uncharacterized membrane protein